MYSAIKTVLHRINNFIPFQISLLIRLVCILLATFILAGFTTHKADAASGIKIYDYLTKKTSTYTGVIPTVICNGTKIGNTATPGILINGIAVLPYDDVFQNSRIAAECSYNKNKNTITITKYGTTIGMTVGSKKATVNGKSVSLSVAPVKIKYVNSDITKVLVPSRFVSETLGLGYNWNGATSTITIEKHTIQLSYNENEKFEYSGAQGKVTIDGKSVNLGSMPSIITNNTAMLRAKKVFADSAIDADYYYDKASKKITLIKGDNVVIMTVGSTEALLNNKTVKLDAAPIVVTNCETNTSYVMVPGSFTAASLGYDYQWNKTTKTSMITSRKTGSDTSGNQSGTAPELGDSGAAFETGTILNQWNYNSALYGITSGIHELSGTGTSTGTIYLANRDYDNVRQNSETFAVVASSAYGKVTASSTGNQIIISAENMLCTDTTYQMYGISSNYISTIGFYNAANSVTTIELEMIPSVYYYDISFSADQTILYITVYLNTVNSVIIGTNTSGDYLTLTGSSPLTVTITEMSGYMYIDVPYSLLGTGDIVSEISGASYMKQIYGANSSDKAQLIIAVTDGYQYYTMSNGSQYTILFLKSDDSDPTGDGNYDNSNGTDSSDEDNSSDGDTSSDSSNEGGTVVNADIPIVQDKSKYEIVIPRPVGVATSQITHEDYYNSHYFVLRIPGDYKDFYESNMITYTSSVISKISVTVNSSNQTVIKIATTKLQGYELAADDNNLYVNIGNPKEIYKNIVLLDPGHGGSANGANYYGTNEKDVNFAILYTYGKKYFNSDPSKLKVYYTRTSDTNPGLSERAAMSKTYGADLYVSLHMNSAEATVVGTEVFYSGKNNLKNSAGLSAYKLASIFCSSLTDRLGMDSRGVKNENFTVIYKNSVPAILIELGFLSTKSEYAKLTDPTFQDNAAKAIYETLLEVFEAYPTGR